MLQLAPPPVLPCKAQATNRPKRVLMWHSMPCNIVPPNPTVNGKPLRMAQWASQNQRVVQNPTRHLDAGSLVYFPSRTSRKFD